MRLITAKYNVSTYKILQGTITSDFKNKSSAQKFLYCMTIFTTPIGFLTQGLTPYMHTGPANNISGPTSVLMNHMLQATILSAELSSELLTTLRSSCIL